MVDHAEIFRKRALDRLSPLDEVTEPLSIGQSYANRLFVAVGAALVLGLFWAATAEIPVTATWSGMVLDERGRAVIYMAASDVERIRTGQTMRLRAMGPAALDRAPAVGHVVEVDSDDRGPDRIFGVPVIVALAGEARDRLPANTRVVGEADIGMRRPITLILPESWR